MGRRNRNKNIDHLDTHIIFPECGNDKWVNFESAIVSGWPRCCGQSMDMTDTQPDIDRLADDLISSRKDEKIRIMSKYSERRYIP